MKFFNDWMIISFFSVSVSISVRQVHEGPVLWWCRNTCQCPCLWVPWVVLSVAGLAGWESEDSSCPFCSSSCAQSGTGCEPSLSQLGGEGKLTIKCSVVAFGKGRHTHMRKKNISSPLHIISHQLCKIFYIHDTNILAFFFFIKILHCSFKNSMPNWLVNFLIAWHIDHLLTTTTISASSAARERLLRTTHAQLTTTSHWHHSWA